MWQNLYVKQRNGCNKCICHFIFNKQQYMLSEVLNVETGNLNLDTSRLSVASCVQKKGRGGFGIPVTESFQGRKGCKMAAAKAIKGLEIPKKIYTSRDGAMITKFCKSLVTPYFEYTVLVLSPYLTIKHAIDTLGNVQLRN